MPAAPAHSDAGGRKHVLTVTLAPSYPTVTDGSTTHAQLPVPWVPSNSWTSLQQLLDEFKQVGGAEARPP